MTPAIEADLSKLKKTTRPRIKGIRVKDAAIYLISFAWELEIQAIIIAPRAGRKIINERILKFNLLPPTRNYTLLKINTLTIKAMIPSPMTKP